MLRNCVSLLSQMSPLTVSCRFRRSGITNRVYKPLFIEMNKRRKIVELDNKLKNKDAIQRRSSHSDWNYTAELKALQSRLGEKMNDALLVQSLIMKSHLEMEKQKQEDLGVEVSEAMTDNSQLADEGRKLISDTLLRWLRSTYKRLPEEMIQELKDHLMSQNMMADIGFHIGLREIVLSEEYPPSAASLTKCLEAVIGVVASNDKDRASSLVIDLFATQLHGKEIQEICSKSLSNPMRILKTILRNSGLPEPEPRLLFQTGPDTILSSHLVGLYCNREIIGQSYGETLDIAEEMAARDALRNIFDTAEYSCPPAYKQPEDSNIDNPSLSEYKTEPKNIVMC